MNRIAVFALALLCAAPRGPAHGQDLPTEIGWCNETRIVLLGSRLENDPESGSFVRYENGITQTSYDVIGSLHVSRIGDPVQLCLVFVPEDCPPGDDRGKIYAATNLRTGDSWEAPDSPHSCGGA